MQSTVEDAVAHHVVRDVMQSSRDRAASMDLLSRRIRLERERSRLERERLEALVRDAKHGARQG